MDYLNYLTITIMLNEDIVLTTNFERKYINECSLTNYMADPTFIIENVDENPNYEFASFFNIAGNVEQFAPKMKNIVRTLDTLQNSANQCRVLISYNGNAPFYDVSLDKLIRIDHKLILLDSEYGANAVLHLFEKI